MQFSKLICRHSAIKFISAVVLALGIGQSAFCAIIEVSLSTNNIIYDPFSNQIFATVPSTAGARGNSITPINPTTGALGTSVFVGSEPNKLAISDNGQYLYFGLDGAAAARRFDIATLTPGLQFPLGNNSFGPNLAEDIEVLPGNSSAVAVSLRNTCCSPKHEGVAIFVDGVKLTNQTPGHTGSNVIEFSSSSATLYGYNNETTDYGFRTMSVDANGAATTNSTGGLISGFGVDIEYAGGRVYSTTGRIIDPVTRTLVGTFAANGPVAPDPAAGQVYFLAGNKIQSFNSNTFLLNWDLTVPGVSGTTARIIRFGDHGLAFRTTGNQVFLVTDPRIGLVPEPSAVALFGLAVMCIFGLRAPSNRPRTTNQLHRMSSPRSRNHSIYVVE